MYLKNPAPQTPAPGILPPRPLSATLTYCSNSKTQVVFCNERRFTMGLFRAPPVPIT